MNINLFVTIFEMENTGGVFNRFSNLKP